VLRALISEHSSARHPHARPAHASAAVAAPLVAEPDVFEQLRKLAELRDAGIVTSDEFDAKKAELLSRM
jgi:hypothetical protein